MYHPQSINLQCRVSSSFYHQCNLLLSGESTNLGRIQNNSFFGFAPASSCSSCRMFDKRTVGETVSTFPFGRNKNLNFFPVTLPHISSTHERSQKLASSTNLFLLRKCNKHHKLQLHISVANLKIVSIKLPELMCFNFICKRIQTAKLTC